MKTMEKVVKDFPLLRGEILKALSLKKWNYSDLARETNYSADYVRAFMAGIQGSEKMAKKIVEALELDRYLAT